MRFFFAVLRKLREDPKVWGGIKKVLKALLEVVSFIAAIKTIFS